MDSPSTPHPQTPRTMEMTGLRRPIPSLAVALVLAIGVMGCHLTGGLPVELSSGHGRVDRTFTASLGNSVQAAVSALDDLGVHPKEASVRAVDAVSDIGAPGWPTQTNAEYIPDDQAFRNLFDQHLLAVPNSEPTRFNPILVTYKGETVDGQTVTVIVRAQPPDASQTMVMTRVGRSDEVAGKKLIVRIAERLKEQTKAAPAPTPATPDAAAPAPPAAAETTAAPAGLPPLPQ